MADDQNPELPLTPPPGGSDGAGPGAANIQPVNIEEEMKRSYLDYSMSVIIGRALPDVRDGLKPVHRRILYTMQQMGLQPNKATRKCARIVGEVMGKYHPHGNLAVYDALVRLAQDWSMRYPLIFGQGNFGSVDGDPPAADRYTEAKLAQVSTALLEDLDKETVDFHDNYDGSEIEPDVLPARIPNLLINGSDGIAVGMATKIPPHNLTEIVDATITLVNNPNAQLAEILKFVQGPDFPDRRHDPRPRRNFRSLPHRPRPLHDARQSRHRNLQQRSRSHHRHRNSLSGEQSESDQAHRGSWSTTKRSKTSPTFATKAIATACASSSN